MLSREMYTEAYIQELHKRTGNDPALLERVVFAFGLLEAIRRVGLPFCFKGGTSLMLLLNHPRRLSTDIDIIVEPGTDIDEYIHKAGDVFPFMDVEEQIRVGKNNIEKRHFRFKYHSPRNDRDLTILLVEPSIYYGQKIGLQNPKRFSYLRIVDPIAYGYIVESGKVLEGTEFAE